MRRPQLHLKAQFFTSRESWEAVLSHPVLADAMRVYVLERAHQASATGYVSPTRMQEALNDVARGPLSAHVEGLPPEIAERTVMYLCVGSQNQDYRGMFLDGEVAFVTSGWESVWGLLDFVLILGMSDWVDDVEGVERHLGRYSWWQRHIGRIATILM